MPQNYNKCVQISVMKGIYQGIFVAEFFFCQTKIKKLMTDEEKLEAGKQNVPGEDAGVQQKSGWRNYLSSRNKDLNLDDDEAVGQYLEGEFGRLDKSDEVTKRLNELISKDKRNAGLYAGAFSGVGDNGEPFNMVDYIVSQWFDELHDATNSEEAIERINRKMAEQEEEAAQAAKRDEDAKQKFEAMGRALSAAIKQTNIDEATAQKVVDWLYGKQGETEDEYEPGLYSRIPERSVTEDDWIKLIHAFTRDKSLEDARNEGKRLGKEQRSGANHRSASAMAQTDLGGGGGGAERENNDNPTVNRYNAMKPRFT